MVCYPLHGSPLLLNFAIAAELYTGGPLSNFKTLYITMTTDLTSPI